MPGAGSGLFRRPPVRVGARGGLRPRPLGRTSVPISPPFPSGEGAPRRARMSRARLPVDRLCLRAARVTRASAPTGVALAGVYDGERKPWGEAPPRRGTRFQAVNVSLPPPPAGATATSVRLRPQIRRDNPLNLSILLSGGKETNQDSLSSGERRGKSPAPNPRPTGGRGKCGV